MEKINTTRFRKDMEKHETAGVDSSIFIYQFEENPHFAPLCSVVFDLLSQNKIRLVTSAITASEILVQPFLKKDLKTVALYENVLSTLPRFSLVPVTLSLAKTAAYLRAKYTILLPDAFQLAATLQENASAFITNDQKLKKVREITVLCLKDYL